MDMKKKMSGRLQRQEEEGEVGNQEKKRPLNGAPN